MKLYCTEEAVDRAIARAKSDRESSTTEAGDEDDAVDGAVPIAVDIEYIADGTREPCVRLAYRLVLHTDPPKAETICNALKDICARLTGTLEW